MPSSNLLRTAFGAIALWSLATAWPAVAAGLDAAAASDPVSDLMERRYDELRRTSIDSSDLRLRILFSRGTRVNDDATTIVDLVPLATLLDASRGSTDPLVLQLLLGRCSGDAVPAACDAVALARRWAVADAQNQAAWIELATLQERAGDEIGARQSWEQAGRASTIRDPMYDYARLVVAALPVDPDPRLRHLDLLFAVGVAGAVETPWLWDATHACRKTVSQRVCAHVAEAAFRDATTFPMLFVGRSLAVAGGGSPSVVADRQRTEQALSWAQGRLLESMDFVTFGVNDASAWHKANHILEDQIARGEIAPARDTLRDERISEADGAARYASSLNSSAKGQPAR